MTAQYHEEYLKSIKAYPQQFETAWREVHKLKIPEDVNPIRDVILAGMGGSNFGGRVVKSVFANDDMVVPLEILNNYDIPAYADEETLVILSSFSGNTEEVLSVFKQAQARGCKIFVITGGGKLRDLVNSNTLNGYVYDPKYNYSKAPRNGIGYALGGVVAILSVLGLVEYKEKDFESTLNYLKSFIKTLDNEDKMTIAIAQKLFDKVPVFITADHLVSSAWIWRNFMNETAKHKGFQMQIPELNHHFLDGLMYPKSVDKDFLFVYVKSKFYNERNSLRVDITRELIRKYGFNDLSISLGAKSKFDEAWELIIIGCMVSYHLAKMHGANPSSNEYVDLLKQRLG